jgi:hypothetical protein
MCDHVWIFEARTRRRIGMCDVYRMEPRCREPTHRHALNPTAAPDRSDASFAGRTGLRCGHTRTGSDQRDFLCSVKAVTALGAGQSSGRHCRSVGLLRLDALTFESCARFSAPWFHSVYTAHAIVAGLAACSASLPQVMFSRLRPPLGLRLSALSPPWS